MTTTSKKREARSQPFKIFFVLFTYSLLATCCSRSSAIEIPLETVTSSRVGYIDLERIFNTYPEKSFAEGDLLREIEKRRKNLSQRQNQINLLRQQIAADQATLDQARAGRSVVVPANTIVTAEPAAPTPEEVKPTVQKSSSSIEAYPTDDPLAGLPGHEVGNATLPGMQGATESKPKPTTIPVNSYPLLESLSNAASPAPLSPEAQKVLQQRIDDNRKTLDRLVYDFKDFRVKAVEDMKTLQTQKTYDIMSKIYAILQNVAREENVTVVMDKAYVLYGEDTVDLTDKLMTALQQQPTEGSPL